MRAALIFAGLACLILATAIVPAPSPASEFVLSGPRMLPPDHSRLLNFALDINALVVKRSASLGPTETRAIQSRLTKVFRLCENKPSLLRRGSQTDPVFDCFARKVAELDIAKAFGPDIKVLVPTSVATSESSGD